MATHARHSRRQTRIAWAGVAAAVLCLAGLRANGADYGRVSGTVTDSHGIPLTGVTVLVMGPTLAGSYDLTGSVVRVITDVHGKFAVERLVPGRYSVRVTSTDELPVFRSGIQVAPGETATLSFILRDIFAPFRVQAPPSSVSNLGDDWKWILRTSASTRPILRYQDAAAKQPATPHGPAQCLIGITPGVLRQNPLSADQGQGSVLAYLRPLSGDSDLLVAGSMAAAGLGTSSVVTAFRRRLIGGNAQELALVVHQMSLSNGPVPARGQAGLTNGQGVVASYAQTRRLSSALTLTTGFEIDYLNASADAAIARPKATLEYRVSRSSRLTASYGAEPTSDQATLLEQVGELNAFPRVTLSGYRPRLEKVSHAEVSYDRQIGQRSHVEVAAYRDRFQDSVVRGFGQDGDLASLQGTFLPNTSANGLNLNAGRYDSAGLRAVVSERLSKSLRADAVYSTGNSLVLIRNAAEAQSSRGLRDLTRPVRTASVSGRLTAELARTKTQVATSYEWLPDGRLTQVDPYGQASYGIDPYLGVQIRQPLPTLAFLPAHIEALADFSNLLGQGYVRLANGGDRLILAPECRSLRGGFSVQF